MHLFISWSGETSGEIARALREALPDVVPFLDPWMSEVDAGLGSHWNDELWSALSRAEFAVACVTTSNRGSPWLHFELGALARSASSRAVAPLLFHMDSDALPLPLSQFQAVALDRQGLARLIRSVNDVHNTRDLIPDCLQRLEHYWPTLAAQLDQIPDPSMAFRTMLAADADCYVVCPVSPTG